MVVIFLKRIFETQLIYSVVLISAAQQSDSFSYSVPLWFTQDIEYSSLCYMIGPC